jgi:hypothetical protein
VVTVGDGCFAIPAEKKKSFAGAGSQRLFSIWARIPQEPSPTVTI